MKTYDIQNIFIENEIHSVKNSILSIEDKDFQFYFESPAQDKEMIKFIFEGVLGKRVTIFAKDNHGILITLVGCVFSPTITFNDMIRQEEFLYYKTFIIERIFIGDHVKSNSVYKSLSVQICFDDKSVRDGLNRNDKLSMNRIINESFKIEYDNFSYDISCSNDLSNINITGENSTADTYMSKFWVLFDLFFIFHGYCLIAKSFNFTKDDSSKTTYYFGNVGSRESASDFIYYNPELIIINSDTMNENVLNKWFRIHDTATLSLNVFMASQSQIRHYPETRFLMISQCIEGYFNQTREPKDTTRFADPIRDELIDLINHFVEDDSKYSELCETAGINKHEMNVLVNRSLKHINKIGFRKILKSIFTNSLSNKIIKSSEKKEFIDKVYNTRNFYTHLPVDESDSRFVGSELLNVNWRLSYAFRINIINELGIISKIDNNNVRMFISRIDSYMNK